MKKQNIPCITLLTDFGHKDHFVGTMKGVIKKINPRADIIDICHEVKPQDVRGGAFLLSCAYNYFPKNTLHVAVVDPGVGSKRKIILVKTKNYFFLAPDNGILSYVRHKENFKKIINVTNKIYFLPQISNTFHGRDIFAPVAAHLAKGTPPKQFGKMFDACGLFLFPFPKNKQSKNSITGEIIYIDRFGNLITTIKKDDTGKEGVKEIYCKGRKIKKHAAWYSGGNPGELISIFGSAGFLEIACVNGSAQKKLRAKAGDKIVIHLKNKK